MNRPWLKYKQLFANLLLCAYLVGNLSIPLFEGVHFLLHLGDNTPLHSFQSHDNQHQHLALADLSELVSNTPLTHFPSEKTYKHNLKKIVQQLETTTTLSFTDLFINTTNYTTLFVAHKTPFLQLNSPPPEV